MDKHTYLLVEWLHQNADYPVLLYSELDAERWETRKVEVFADGRQGFADHEEQVGGSFLAIEQCPSVEDIARDKEFEPHEITMSDFERVCSTRRQRVAALIRQGR